MTTYIYEFLDSRGNVRDVVAYERPRSIGEIMAECSTLGFNRPRPIGEPANEVWDEEYEAMLEQQAENRNEE